MQAPEVKDKVITSKTGGPMTERERQTDQSLHSKEVAPQFSGAKPGEAAYTRMSQLDKTKAQDAFPGNDKAMTLPKNIFGPA